MARLLCLCLALVVGSAGAFEDAQAFVQGPVLEHLKSGGASVYEKFMSIAKDYIANGGDNDAATAAVKDLQNLVADEYGADLLKVMKGAGVLEPNANIYARDEDAIGPLIKTLFPNAGNQRMHMALNYATAGEKAEEVGLKVASTGCATDTECNIHEGDTVEMSMKKDFSFALKKGDSVSVEMHLKYDDVPTVLQVMEHLHPERIFKFECPACGAKCKLSFDKSFPGLKLFIPTFAQEFGSKFAPILGVNTTLVDTLNLFNKEVELTMPECPQIVRPLKHNVLAAVWKPPAILKPIMLTALRAVKLTLTSKVNFKHSDGQLIWGLSSMAKLG